MVSGADVYGMLYLALRFARDGRLLGVIAED